MRLLIILGIVTIFTSLNARYISVGQYNTYQQVKISAELYQKKLNLPKKSVDILLAIALRESSFGLSTISDDSTAGYYYLHNNKRVYITEAEFFESKIRNGKRYVYIQRWGRTIAKRLRFSKKDAPILFTSSFGVMRVKLNTALHVFSRYPRLRAAKIYTHSTGKGRYLINKNALAIRLMKDIDFNVMIAAYYLKINYEKAKWRYKYNMRKNRKWIAYKYRNPLFAAVSMHNGGWKNKVYKRRIKRDLKTIKKLKKIRIGRHIKIRFVNGIETLVYYYK